MDTWGILTPCPATLMLQHFLHFVAQRSRDNVWQLSWDLGHGQDAFPANDQCIKMFQETKSGCVYWNNPGEPKSCPNVDSMCGHPDAANSDRLIGSLNHWVFLTVTKNILLLKRYGRFFGVRRVFLFWFFTCTNPLDPISCFLWNRLHVVAFWGVYSAPRDGDKTPTGLLCWDFVASYSGESFIGYIHTACWLDPIVVSQMVVSFLFGSVETLKHHLCWWIGTVPHLVGLATKPPFGDRSQPVITNMGDAHPF